MGRELVKVKGFTRVVNGKEVETRPYLRAKQQVGPAPPTYDFFDCRALRRLRKELGLSLKEAEAATGVPWQTINHYEQGRDFKKNNRGRHPLLHRFQAVCSGYGLDPFQVCELLRLQPVPKDLLRKFRSACREEGVTPLQALLDFMRVYCR